MMKKLMSVVLVLALSLSLAAVAFAATDATVVTYVDGGSLKLRTGPGTNYGVAGWVQDGWTVSVLQKGDRWSKVKAYKTGKTGYLKNTYLAYGETKPETKPDPKPDCKPVDPSSLKLVGSIVTKTAGGSVNLRSQPSTCAASNGSLTRGTRLTIDSLRNGWYRVKTFDGRSGYVYSDYVFAGISATVTGRGVNMRRGAGTSYAVVSTLAKGTAITVLGIDGNWSKVKVGSATGYISNSYYAYK